MLKRRRLLTYHFLASLGAIRRRPSIERVALCVGLSAAFSASGAAAESPADAGASTDACVSSALSLENAYATVRVGGLALASDSVLGGPPQCVGSVSTDSSNVRVSLQKKGETASVRIWALHEGFANVTVRAQNGVEIGVVRVSVYPREPHPHKGGR